MHTTAHGAQRRGRRHLGFSFVEALVSTLILAFVAFATVRIYTGGTAQQRLARYYSAAQAANREGFRRMLRSIRHAGWSGSYVGVGVLMSNTTPAASSFFSPQDSGTNQIIVLVPQASPGDQIRFYVDNAGNLYGQTKGDAQTASPGTVLAMGVTGLTFNYYRTVISSGVATTTPLDNSSGKEYKLATEVEISMTAQSAGVSSTETAYVEMRNMQLGL